MKSEGAAGTVAAAQIWPRRRPTSGELIVKLIYGTVFIVALALVMLPVLSLLYGSFRSGGPGSASAWTLRNWADIDDGDILRTFVNTLGMAVSTALLSTGLGGLFAWVVYRTDFRFKGPFTGVVAVSFVFPGFILAMAWIILGSPGGIVNFLLRQALGSDVVGVDIYSLGGIVWILTLHLIPVTFFTLRGPLLSMDASLEEAAEVAGARTWKALTRVTLPLLRYPILSSLLLVFVLAIEQFAIPALVGIPGHVNVLATELYLLVNFEPPKPGLAAAIGLTMTVATAAAFFCQRRVASRTNVTTIGGKAYKPRLVALHGMRWPVDLLCLLFALTGCVAPLLALIYTSVVKYSVANPFQASYTLRAYASLLSDPSVAASFWNTLVVAGGGAFLALLLGGLIAFFVQRMRLRGSRVIETASSIAFGIPGVVVGLGFLWSFVYLPIYGTVFALVVCYVSRFLPYATETVTAQLRQIDKSLDEAAAMSGATPLLMVRRILAPLALPALQGAFLLLFVTFFREIAAAALLYTPASEVVSITIWTYFENADWGRASALSLIATVVVLVAMALALRVQTRAEAFKSSARSATP